MEIKTKRYIEFSEEHKRLIKALESFYDVKFTVTAGRRVDAYEAEQTHREACRSDVFKDVKTTLCEAVRVRYWYYRNIVNLSYKDTLIALSDGDFVRSVESIKKYLEQCRNIECDALEDVHKRYPIFDWSGKKPHFKSVPYMSRKERQQKRERIITAYYYFYADCLNYSDIDSEYIICYRDFYITPKQLGRIIEDNSIILQELRRQGKGENGLRRLFPAFSWDCSVLFRDESDLLD